MTTPIVPDWISAYGESTYLGRVGPVPRVPDFYAPGLPNRHLAAVAAAMRGKQAWPLDQVVAFLAEHGPTQFGVEDIDLSLLFVATYPQSPFMLIVGGGHGGTLRKHYIHANLVRSYVYSRFISDSEFIPLSVLRQFIASRLGGVVA